MWRFRGTPHYLQRQAARLKVPPLAAKQAEVNREIHRISTVLAQLCERCNRARQEEGRPVFSFGEKQQVEDVLASLEIQSSKLFALAAASHDMLDEAYDAAGADRPIRRYCVMSDYDDDRTPSPNGEHTIEGKR